MLKDLASKLNEALVAPALAFPDEEPLVRSGAFKVSGKILDLIAKETGRDVSQMLFHKQRATIEDIPWNDLPAVMNKGNMADAQDVIAGNPRSAFQTFLANIGKVSPKAGTLIRAIPENAPLLWYIYMKRVSGDDLADILFTKFWRSDTADQYKQLAKTRAEQGYEVFKECPICGAPTNRIAGAWECSKFPHHREAWDSKQRRAGKMESRISEELDEVYVVADAVRAALGIRVGEMVHKKVGYRVMREIAGRTKKKQVAYEVFSLIFKGAEPDWFDRLWSYWDLSLRDIKELGRRWEETDRDQVLTVEFAVTNRRSLGDDQHTIRSAPIAKNIENFGMWEKKWVFAMRDQLLNHLSGRPTELMFDKKSGGVTYWILPAGMW